MVNPKGCGFYLGSLLLFFTVSLLFSSEMAIYHILITMFHNCLPDRELFVSVKVLLSGFSRLHCSIASSTPIARILKLFTSILGLLVGYSLVLARFYYISFFLSKLRR